MMPTTDIDLTLYFRKKHTPPPSVLLFTLPKDKSNKDRQFRASSPIEPRSRQQKKRQLKPHTAGLQASDSDSHEFSVLSYGWQRYTDKISQIIPAPDIVYRNTYLEESKREKSATINSDHRSCISSSRSPSPRSQPSQQQQQQQIPRLKTASTSSQHTSDSSQRKSYHQYRTVYDYIRESIKQIERQRNLKQHNFSTRIKRPQNDDAVLRRVLGEKKPPGSAGRSSISRTTLQNPQSLVNYLNHSRDQVRVLHTTTPNQAYLQPQIHLKYRQPRNLSQNQNDSLDKQQSLMMTATVGNL